MNKDDSCDMSQLADRAAQVDLASANELIQLICTRLQAAIQQTEEL